MTPNTISLAVTAALGACWGSFLNGAYHSTLAEMPLVTPPSHGPNCKTSVKPWFNVPVLGWLLRQGRRASSQEPARFKKPTAQFLTASFFVGCYCLTHDALSACLLGAVFTLYALGAACDHQTFFLPGITLQGALVAAIALAVLRPEATDPVATNANVRTAILNHFAGGAALLIVIMLVKKIGEHFLRAACEGRTQFEISSKGVAISDECGCEFIPWDDFRFTKIIPRKDILCIRDGKAENLEPGEIEIRDGSVRCRGHGLDLGLDLGEEKITIQTTEFVAYRNAMGLGDVLLAPSLGILLGFNIGLFEMFLLASMTGTAHGLYLKRNDRRLPFGPHLMGATAYVILSRYHLVPSLAKAFGFPV
jgi:prepilin signal peptidase PulO-like enzyme (type II secretory pathway)